MEADVLAWKLGVLGSVKPLKALLEKVRVVLISAKVKDAKCSIFTQANHNSPAFRLHDRHGVHWSDCAYLMSPDALG